MNQRPEAGHTSPPLRPRLELISSLTAAPSRERYASHFAPLIATEELRTGNEGMLAAVRRELAGVYLRIPETDVPHDTDHIKAVVIASSNNKKTDDFLQQISHHQLRVERVPEAREQHWEDAELDATSKAIDAHRFLQERMAEIDVRRELLTMPYVTIANDQMNAVPIIVDHPVTHLPIVAFQPLGKPKTANPENPTEGVRSTLQNMADLAEKYGWKSVPYIPEVATVIHNPQDPEHNAVSRQRSAVFLSVDGLKHLATDKFDEYLEAVQKQAGHANGKADATEIAGGLEFQVLRQMGIIDFVSGSQDEIQTAGFPPHQRPEAYTHAYNLVLGTPDPELIKQYFVPSQSTPTDQE